MYFTKKLKKSYIINTGTIFSTKKKCLYVANFRVNLKFMLVSESIYKIPFLILNTTILHIENKQTKIPL